MSVFADSDKLTADPQQRRAPQATMRPGPWASLVREPLVHFLVLGGLIFGLDYVLHPPSNAEQTIVVTKGMRQAFIENFDEDKERTPSPEILAKMVDSWVASEILYREGKRLGVDRGDDMIRDRIAFKLQSLIFDQIKIDGPTDAELRDWFQANHAQFDEPESVSFFFTPPADEATARRDLEAIEAQRDDESLQRKTRAVLARPVASLAAGFGETFADALLKMPMGQWSLMQSTDGWQVVRLDSKRPEKLASLGQVHDEAVRLWKTEETRKRAWDAVSRLKASYAVRVEQ